MDNAWTLLLHHICFGELLNSTGAYYPEKNGLVFRFKKAKSGKPLQMDDKMFALSKVK
jgi:ribosomal protein L24E